jgi:uncharacterized protein (UPF0548 family)
MLFLRRPTCGRILGFLTKRESMTFSYPEVGATSATPPASYRIHYMCALLEIGQDVRERSADALFSW